MVPQSYRTTPNGTRISNAIGPALSPPPSDNQSKEQRLRAAKQKSGAGPIGTFDYYDQSGNLTSNVCRDSEGSIVQEFASDGTRHKIVRLDANSRPTAEEILNADGSRTEKIFNADGSRREFCWKDSNKTEGTFSYYDSNQRLFTHIVREGVETTIQEFDPDGTRRITKLRADSKAVSYSTFRPDGSGVEKVYNEDGTSREFSWRNKTAQDSVYRYYDPKGKLTARVERDAQGMTVQIYDGDGHVRKVNKTDLSGRLLSEGIFEVDGSGVEKLFNDDGSRRELSWKGHDRQDCSFSYYDSTGRLLKLIDRDCAGTTTREWDQQGTKVMSISDEHGKLLSKATVSSSGHGLMYFYGANGAITGNPVLIYPAGSNCAPPELLSE